MKITPEKLKEWGACERQLKRFTKRYPKGAKCTKKLAMEFARTWYSLSQRVTWADSFIWLGGGIPHIRCSIARKATKMRWDYQDGVTPKTNYEKQLGELLWQGWKLKGWHK